MDLRSYLTTVPREHGVRTDRKYNTFFAFLMSISMADVIQVVYYNTYNIVEIKTFIGARYRYPFVSSS